MKKITLYFVLISILTVACKKDKNIEIEKNDTVRTATPLVLDSKMKGYLSHAADTDYYKFDVIETSVLDITLTSVKGVNHAIQVWKSFKYKESVLKLVDDSRKSSPERLRNLTVEPGIYYIQIKFGNRDKIKGNKSSHYELNVAVTTPLNEEIEPNDTKESATLIESDTEYAGYFSPAFNKLNKSKTDRLRENDYFKVLVDCSDGPVLFSVYLKEVSGVDSILFLYDENNNLIASSDKNSVSKGEELKDIGIKNSGEYYLLVTAKNYQSNYNDPYSISVMINQYSQEREMEPNNSFNKFNTIYDNYISGVLTSEKDKDVFKILPASKDTETQTFKIEVNSDEETNIKFSVFNDQFHKIYDIDNDKTNQEILPNIKIDKPVYLMVESGLASQVNNINYQVSLSLLEGFQSLEVEPNNDKKQANKVNGNLLSGYLTYKKDIDYFLISDGTRKKKTFSITGVPGGEIEVSITDALGYIINTVNIVDEETKKISEMIDGKAFIIVKSITYNHEKPYTIEIGE